MTHLTAMKHKDKFLGVYQKTENFLLAFPHRSHAEKLRTVIADKPQVLIKRTPEQNENVSRNVKLALLELNMPIYNVKDDIFVNTEAQVAFKKREGSIPSDDTAFELFDIEHNRFLALPYMNKFGIMLPYEFITEDESYVLFKASVMDGFYRDEPIALTD
jgi:hypothetical protein